MFSLFSFNPILLKTIYGLIVFWCVKYALKFIERLRKLPPGPWGLPFVGYLPFLKDETYLQFIELTKKYGSIFSFKCGSYDMVVLNEAKHIHEALASEHLIARPEFLFFGPESAASIFEMSGDVWKEQRRVALKLFRDLGLGKTKLEEKIKDEINLFLEFIKKNGSKTLNFNDCIQASVANNISILLFGHGYEYDDPIAVQMRTNLAAVNNNIHFFTSMLYLPLYYKINSCFNFLKTNLNKTFENFRQFEISILDEVAKHKEKGAGHEIEDYIDGFLQEMKKKADKKDSSFNLATLRRNAADFYSAGADTTALSMNWIMIFLTVYPKHQTRIREEIKRVIGSERQADYNDRHKMPFTMAFISESLRMASVVPLNVLRRVTQKVKIGGVLIPKDTLVAMNFWAVHHDPDLWEDPESFKPERFLNENQTELIKSPNLIPFSEGKRVCPGAGLAWMELFLYVSRIVQKFEIKAPKEKEISKSFDSKYVFFRFPLHSGQFDFCHLD